MIALSRLRRADQSRDAHRIGRSVQILDAAALCAEPEAWDDLLARAVEPHPHFSRHVIEAHRKAGLLRDDTAFICIRTGDRMDALLPFRTGLDITGFGSLVAQPALSPFMPSSTPLIAAEGFDQTLKALVTAFAEASRGRSWRWPLLSLSSRVGSGLLSIMKETGWAIGTVQSFERPILDRRISQDAFLKDHPHKGRLKDLRRRQRRLAEAGTVEFTSAIAGERLGSALDDFLALELAGWKGEAGTAMAARQKTLAFANHLFRAGKTRIGVRADTLSLDGRPLAVSLALIAGGTACLLKTAYDERERAHAPGLLLEAEIIRAFHETAFCDRLDSATSPGSALESLYRDRETMAEIVAVPPRAEGRISVERRVALARFEHRARAEAKRLLKRR